VRFQATKYPKISVQHGDQARPARRPITALGRLLAALVAVLLIGVLVGCGSLPQEMPQSVSPTPTSPVGPVTPSSSDIATPTIGDAVAAQTRHFIGEPGAPVTIIEFGDFQ
jgi:hypothetical protein